MRRNVRLGWIAEVEARRFMEAAMAQRGLAEPGIEVIVAAQGAVPGHWVRRLVGRFARPRDDRKIAQISCHKVLQADAGTTTRAARDVRRA